MTEQCIGYDYRLSVPTDVDGALVSDAAGAPALAWLDHVQPLRIAPGNMAERLSYLAECCRLVRCSPVTSWDTYDTEMVGWIADRLDELAAEATP